MFNWFYKMVDDLLNGRDYEIRELYDRMDTAEDKRKELRVWCEEMLDFANIPAGSFRTEFLTELFADDSEEPELLLDHISGTCMEFPPYSDDEDEDEEDQEEATCVVCSETKTEDWAWNTTPVKNAPVCSDCLELQDQIDVLERKKDILFEYVSDKYLTEIEERFNTESK